VSTATRGALRATFAVGVALFATSIALGIFQSWRAHGAPPELRFDQLGQARELAAAGDREAAVRQLRTYALLHPQHADGWVRLGGYLWQTMGDRPAAIEAYERSLLTLPTPVQTHTALAILYVREGRIDEAREHANMARANGVTLPADVWRALARQPVPPS